MSANLIPMPPTPPNRTDAPDEFNSRANATMAYFPVLVGGINQALPDINAAAVVGPIAVGAANFKGYWSDLTGARPMPATVLHDGALWLLTKNLPNVAAAVPGVSPDWASVTGLLDTFPAGEIGNYVPKSDAATVQQFLSGAPTKHLRADRVWDAAAVQTLTSAATISINMGASINFSLTLGENATLGNPAGGKVGQSGFIAVKQDATGGRTLSYASAYVFELGLAAILDSRAGLETVLFYTVLSSGRVFISPALAVS